MAEIDWRKPVKLAKWKSVSDEVTVEWDRLKLLGTLPISRVVLVLFTWDSFGDHTRFERIFGVTLPGGAGSDDIWALVDERQRLILCLRGVLQCYSSFASSFFTIAVTIILTPETLKSLGGPDAPIFKQRQESLRRLPRKRVVVVPDFYKPVDVKPVVLKLLGVAPAMEIRYFEGPTPTPDLLDPPKRPKPNGSIYTAKYLLRVLPKLLREAEAEDYGTSILVADFIEQMENRQALYRARIDPQDQAPSDGSPQRTAVPSSNEAENSASSALLSQSSPQPSPPSPNGPDEYFAQVRGEWILRLHQAESFDVFSGVIREYLKREAEYGRVIKVALKLQEALERADGSEVPTPLAWC